MNPIDIPNMQSAVLTRAAEAEVLAADASCALTLLVDAPAVGGALTSNRSTFAPGGDGAPPHFHTTMSELIFVLDGALQVLIDDRVTVLEAGDTLVVPPYAPHAFAAPAGRTADALFVFTPGRERFEYYRLLDRLHRGDATLAELLATQDRYDNHYVESPAWNAARIG